MRKFKTNRDGDIEVLWQTGKICGVRFLNTGFERTANIDNIKAGKVKDLSIVERTVLRELDEIVMSNSCGPVRILSQFGKQCTVQFLNTGTTKTANIDNVLAGKVQDPYAITVHGRGYLGDFNRKLTYHTQAKQLWQNMMKRCYCENDPRGYFGKGVTVAERWLCFANFLEDISKLENFDKWLIGGKDSKTRYNLDKDLLFPGNKVYSKETCMFVSEFENKSAGKKNKTFSELNGWQLTTAA